MESTVLLKILVLRVGAQGLPLVKQERGDLEHWQKNDLTQVEQKA